MNAVKAANTEPIPGYRLIEPLGSGGFGEVWKCEVPGGLFKAIKFVRGATNEIHSDGPDGAAQELRALQHVKSLRHPFLLSMDRVEYIDGELVIVMELADSSLHDLLCDCRADGLPGVPRDELLRYFAEVAEVLDLLNMEHGLQHLDVKPRNLFLVGSHIKVADFGLVNSLADLSGNTPSALAIGAATPIYASPESFQGKITPFSDQYSLAIAYHELLVGEPPFSGKNFRQLAMQHLQTPPDLGRLPEADRRMAARALAKDPGGRFPSCMAFVEALRTGNIGAAPRPTLSVPRRPKPATRTDIPVLKPTQTPALRDDRPSLKTTAAEVACDTRAFPTLTREAPAASAAPAGDPLAGCQFLKCVARSPAGETWTARTADGRDRLVRFFFGLDFAADAAATGRLARLRALRHPALEPMEIVGGGEHRLAVLTDLRATTLAARLQECQGAGLPGIPRAEVLDHIDEAAEALDDLFRKHRLRHLGLTPRHLVLADGRVRLRYFGLNELVHMPAGQQPAALNARYAAPESYGGRVNTSSDSYSIALIYYELLTGSHPFRNLSQRQMASPRLRGEPDLSLAPPADRAVLQRALHADPGQRFSNCTDFLAALEAAAPSRSNPALPAMSPDPSLTPTTRSRICQAIDRLVTEATGDLEVREVGAVRYLLHPGRSIQHEFFARLAPGMAKVQLEAFRQQWKAELESSGANSFTMRATLSGGAWRRFLGGQSGLKIRIDTPTTASAALANVLVRLEPVRCGRDMAVRVLEETGPKVLESLRACFQAVPERRNQVRLPFEKTVQVSPLPKGRSAANAVAAQATDISMRGMKLYMPCQPPSLLVQVSLPGEDGAPEVAVPGRIVRALPCDDGRYEVGLRFLLQEEIAANA